ncbi:MAG: hypothetical protein H6721_21175 [Sandaracinus sp.]|nr:hypothetical protein [Sandaracinus sp.]
MSTCSQHRGPASFVRRGALLLVLATLGVAAFALAPSTPSPPVVLLLEREVGGPCHAFCAGPGEAWTAAHCVDGQTELAVRSADGSTHRVRDVEAPALTGAGDVTRRARDDRARLLLGADSPCDGAPRFGVARRGDEVVLRLARTSREGRLGRGGSGTLSASVHACGGDSGAPLLDRQGRVLGLAVGRNGHGCDDGASFFVALP